MPPPEHLKFWEGPSPEEGTPRVSGEPSRRKASGQVCNIRDRERQPSTNQITAITRATPAIEQSYLPDGRNHPAYIAHRTRTRTYQNAQHTAAHAKMDVRSRHRTSPRSSRFVLGKASEYRRRSRSYHVHPLSRRREVAHGVLCSSPKSEQTFFFASERRQIEILCR